MYVCTIKSPEVKSCVIRYVILLFDLLKSSSVIRYVILLLNLFGKLLSRLAEELRRDNFGDQTKVSSRKSGTFDE